MIWFIDIEASSFDNDSYPIEIALGGINPQTFSVTETYSWMIAPMKHWTNWSAEAEKVHGISRDEILLGVDAHEVASEINAIVENQTIWSDAAQFDRRWLNKLMEDTAIAPQYNGVDCVINLLFKTLPEIRLPDADAMMWISMKGAELVSKTNRPHRALADVDFIANKFLDIHREARAI